MKTHSRPDHLALLGSLATQLSSGDLGRNVGIAAAFLRTATGADDCEIFLREPEGGDLLLTECCGPDRNSLMEQSRFAVNVGYPGIVAATGARLVTRNLDRDPRFLRRRALAHGVVAFVSVPIPGDDGPLGCVNLAWRSRPAAIESAAELLSNAALPIGAAIRAGLLSARELVDRAVNAAEAGPGARARACLQTFVGRSGARDGTIALFDPEGGRTSVFSTARAADACADALDGRARCSLLAEGHVVAHTASRSGWPAPCRCLPADAISPLCLPLRSNGKLHGVIVLDRGEACPTPPTRDLVELLTMASAAAAWLARSGPEVPAAGTRSSRAEPVLELRCFGGFAVRLHGESIPREAFARKKALTVLKILLMSAGHPLTRDALVERLWPGIDATSGSNRLHGVVHALRAVIEPYHEQRRWIYICNVGELYYFNKASSHWVDMFAFRQLAALADQAERAGQRNEAIRHFEKALALYRGDLFADEPYADWCELERTRLRHEYVDLATRLANLWIGAREVDRGLSWLRHGLLTDPLREDLHQALMHALLGAGRRREAMKQYEVFAALLRRELDAEPLAETRRLAQLAEGRTARTSSSSQSAAL